MAETTNISWCDSTKPKSKRVGWQWKGAAKHVGVSPEVYQEKISAGFKWCTPCKDWHLRSAFVRDRTRSDGLSTKCAASQSTGRPKGWHERPAINPLTGRPGPAPHAARDNDKIQARQRVNLEVQAGRMPRPDSANCTDCGHVHTKGGRRHEYDHYLGYAAEHHLHVQPVCSACHRRRTYNRGEISIDKLRAAAKIRGERRKTHCHLGHPLTRHKDGGWRCHQCRLEYWRNYNAARST